MAIMNKKAFGLAVLFLCATLAWLVVSILWFFKGRCSAFDVLVALLAFAAGSGMAWNESHKKKRRHLSEVDKNRIP